VTWTQTQTLQPLAKEELRECCGRGSNVVVIPSNKKNRVVHLSGISTPPKKHLKDGRN